MKPVPDPRAPLRFPLQGARLRLRPFVAADAGAVHSVYSDPEVMRWVGYGALARRRDTERVLAEYADHQLRHGFSYWAVLRREDGELIGDAGLYTHGADVELGYTLGRRWWGSGYGSEAARLSLAAAGALGFEHVVALVRPENDRSIRLLTGLGFVRDGSARVFGAEHDRYRFALPAPPAA